MLVISRFGFEGRIWVLIVLVPVHCLLDAFRNSGVIILSRQTHCLDRTPDCTFFGNRIVASKMADRKTGER